MKYRALTSWAWLACDREALASFTATSFAGRRMKLPRTSQVQNRPCHQKTTLLAQPKAERPLEHQVYRDNRPAVALQLSTSSAAPQNSG